MALVGGQGAQTVKLWSWPRACSGRLRPPSWRGRPNALICRRRGPIRPCRLALLGSWWYPSNRRSIGTLLLATPTLPGRGSLRTEGPAVSYQSSETAAPASATPPGPSMGQGRKAVHGRPIGSPLGHGSIVIRSRRYGNQRIKSAGFYCNGVLNARNSFQVDTLSTRSSM